MTWQQFVLEHGRYARVHHLAQILGVAEGEIQRFRHKAPSAPSGRKSFADLFALWHGRSPREEEWPRPRTIGCGYEWLGPELSLLATLTGSTGTPEIARILTERLRALTGDPAAVRDVNALNRGRELIGLQTDDIPGGVTVQAAAREINCRSILYHEIKFGRLKAQRVGRYLVIPHDEWARWKGTRVFPPKGFVQLSRLKRPLGIRSDKLSEWARLGYVPSAVRCNPYGVRSHSTQFGTWWIDAKVLRRLIADRRAGRPMPWHGQPEFYNLRVTWRLWQQRQHPASCPNCAQIWGSEGAPTTFDVYVKRYPPLTYGEKRHLTLVWSAGLSVDDVARHTSTSRTTVLRAIENGVLRAHEHDGHWHVTRMDATRWKARKCTTGDNARSWMSVQSACRFYGFTRADLQAHIESGRLRSKVGDFGAQRGIRYVLKQQVRELRDETGFSEAEAARRVGVSIDRLRVLLRGVWTRGTDRIPFDAVTTAIKRLDSRQGMTIQEAARRLGKSTAWVRGHIVAGTIRVLRAKWQKRRVYVSAPMFRRLQRAINQPPKAPRWSKEWMLVSDAALLAGVSIATVQKWADAGEVKFRTRSLFRRYHRRSVMARARRFWTEGRVRKRAQPPVWLTSTPEAA